MQDVDTQKRKNSQPRQWGCLKLLLIPILLAVACYGGLWMFARYGGKWVISDQIPIPPGSEAVDISLPDRIAGSAVFKYSIYRHSWTPEELSAWFEQEGILFLPNCADAPDMFEYSHCHRSGLRYYGVGNRGSLTNFKVRLYQDFIYFTVPMSEWRDTGGDIPSDGVVISFYENQEEFDTAFYYPTFHFPIPDIEIPTDMTTFSIVTRAGRNLEEWLGPPFLR